MKTKRASQRIFFRRTFAKGRTVAAERSGTSMFTSCFDHKEPTNLLLASLPVENPGEDVDKDKHDD